MQILAKILMSQYDLTLHEGLPLTSGPLVCHACFRPFLMYCKTGLFSKIHHESVKNGIFVFAHFSYLSFFTLLHNVFYQPINCCSFQFLHLIFRQIKHFCFYTKLFFFHQLVLKMKTLQNSYTKKEATFQNFFEAEVSTCYK